MALRDDVLADYHAALREEIHYVGRRLPRGVRVSGLHWGGGAPALMEPHRLSTIRETLAEYFTFVDRFEHAIEVDLEPLRGDEAFPDELARLRPLIADGVVSRRRGMVALTQLGRPFARVVASLFDAYRKTGPAGFSLAV